MTDSAQSKRQAIPLNHPTEGAFFADSSFDAIFDSSAEALVVVDRDGALQRANPHARELLRWNAAKQARPAFADLVAGTSSHRLRELISADAPIREPHGFDASLPTGFPVRVTLRAVLPGSRHLLLCIEDGSLIQRADSKWRQLEAELRSVLDSVPAGILLMSLSGQIRFSSARFGQLFGLEVRTLAQLKDFDGLADILAERFRNPESFSAPWQSFSAGLSEPGHDELEMTRPARRLLERYFRLVLDSEGRPVGWLELYTDVTGERQIQSKMLQTEKMAALGQLVSGIAHELNNPLTAIMGYAQLLLGHGLMPGQLSEASKVFQEAERARHIVKNLLYFARENRAERTRVNLNEIIERTLALRSYELKVADIAVTCELAPGLPTSLADPHQLQQVVLNLLVNAEQAILEGRGKGHVWISTSFAPAASPEDARRILLRVCDDGPGISPEIASRIFDPFFTTKPSGIDTGLGLSIVYGIVHQHGGEITMESQAGAGARFLVELPVVSVSEENRGATIRSPDSAPGGGIAGRILVVEDEATVAQLITDVLSEEGHHVEAVLDSQEGLTRLSRGEYDLVLCDLRMPRLDGPAFFEALVRSGSPMQDRIIFVTGDTLAPRTTEFLESNQLPYLSKPFLVEELKLAVNRHLERNRELASAASASRSGPVTAMLSGAERSGGSK